MMQFYPPPPELLAVPVEHRLTAAVCLVSLTILLVSMARKLRLRLGAYPRTNVGGGDVHN